MTAPDDRFAAFIERLGGGAPSGQRVPVIDLFAGAGGLGEGFCAYVPPAGGRRFELRLSVEKDAAAHRTLEVRSLFRAFPAGRAPQAYYDLMRGDISFDEFRRSTQAREALAEAGQEALLAELGPGTADSVDRRIASALGQHSDWVLIGGPPCQAYSLAGRSRRSADPARFESDHRHLLYREYLRIIRRFSPAVFVLENVKGMLSSTLGGTGIFGQILRDLASPGGGATYEIRSLRVAGGELSPADYVIRAEEHGVPQRRHRVLLVGVRQDLAARLALGGHGHDRFLLPQAARTHCLRDVLRDLPELRGAVSDHPGSQERWRDVLRDTAVHLRGWLHPGRAYLDEAIHRAWRMSQSRRSPGGRFVMMTPGAREELAPALRAWYHDPRLGGVPDHEARSHMPRDLQRYLFASCFAGHYTRSPRLDDFPGSLLPRHANVRLKERPFSDRFRVQLPYEPATTVVSHIARDGHYYIHPDPSQCRSLTVREAARVQTFPDNYYFAGGRSDQYRQIGNAVPPLLARSVAGVVADILGSVDLQPQVDDRIGALQL